jgi:phosphoglycerate dehydrogenase-like enzyme
MMMLNVVRKIPIVIKDGWKEDYVKHQGMELKGKTVGIVGLGSIGTRIAELCAGLGMKVVYWSKNSRDDRFEYQELRNLMKNADIVLPAVAQNEETNGLITDVLSNFRKYCALYLQP